MFVCCSLPMQLQLLWMLSDCKYYLLFISKMHVEFEFVPVAHAGGFPVVYYGASWFAETKQSV